LPSSNARSSTQSTEPQELVYLISRLVVGEKFTAHHVEDRGRCRTCHELSPCDGEIRAQAVIGLQQRRCG